MSYIDNNNCESIACEYFRLDYYNKSAVDVIRNFNGKIIIYICINILVILRHTMLFLCIESIT